jgi:hypothetical protein
MSSFRKGTYLTAATAILVAVVSWSQAGCQTGCNDNPRIALEANTGTHTSDPCVATLSGARSLHFDFPGYCSDCVDAGSDALVVCHPEEDAGIVPEGCGRDEQGLFISSNGASAEQLFNFLGASQLSLTVSCAGQQLPQNSISGFASTTSCGE